MAVHVIQRPLALNPPNINVFIYPQPQINLKSNDNILIGKKVCEITDCSENKVNAIKVIGLGCLLLVASIIAASLGQVVLSSVFTFAGLTSATAGSGYLLLLKFFDPVKKLEAQREKMRSLPLESILAKDLADIEGLDLLKKAIEDKTSDPKEKIRAYACLRQLKAAFENLKVIKNAHENNIEARFQDRINYLNQWKDHEIREIYAAGVQVPQVLETDKADVRRLHDESKFTWENWKRDAKIAVDTQYRDAVNNLGLKYQKIIDDLGKKHFWFF
jgi:hypothetical protein